MNASEIEWDDEGLDRLLALLQRHVIRRHEEASKKVREAEAAEQAVHFTLLTAQSEERKHKALLESLVPAGIWPLALPCSDRIDQS